MLCTRVERGSRCRDITASHYGGQCCAVFLRIWISASLLPGIRIGCRCDSLACVKDFNCPMRRTRRSSRITPQGERSPGDRLQLWPPACSLSVNIHSPTVTSQQGPKLLPRLSCSVLWYIIQRWGEGICLLIRGIKDIFLFQILLPYEHLPCTGAKLQK